MSLPYYGRLSALAMDPIEKKPLYHFLPGRPILSAGFFGCNLRCPFCQNSSISQFTEETSIVEPEILADAAQRKGSIGVAYTYSEPAVHLEYIIKTAELIKAAGLKNVLVTNGQLTKDAAEMLYPMMDGINIDLKSYRSSFYKQELKGDLATVKQNIEIAHKVSHMEITTLLIPGKNNSSEELQELTGFIADLSPQIPLHISAYHPSYHYSLAGTTIEELNTGIETAKQRLDFVYGGNLYNRHQNTVCPSCGDTLVYRNGWSVQIEKLQKNVCQTCGTVLPIVTD